MDLIYGKMINVMRAISPVGKSQKNKDQGWMFRGIDDMYNTLHELLAKEGIIVKPEVLSSETSTFPSQRGGTIFKTVKRIKYSFVAEDGSEFVTIMDGEGMDTGDKSGSKAESIAHKYDLIQVFLIPTADLAEPDKDVYEVAEEPNGKNVQKKTKDHAVPPTKNPDGDSKAADDMLNATEPTEDKATVKFREIIGILNTSKKINDKQKAEIMGESLKAKGNADELERILAALKEMA